ncbi:MAG: hypothetical protein JKY19_15035, partial [Alcanivoracaceae bacterium]|nr:hypothetical protein [Alcanivoracaceae bacterium]
SADCSRLQNAWDVSSDDGYWSIDPSIDMLPPSGGIMGNVILIDVNEGVAVSEDATVLDDFSDEVLHFNIDNDSPSLADGKVSSTIDSFGQRINMDWSTGFEAVSSVMMKANVSNEYTLDTSINARTDWIVTMPTAHFHTDPINLANNEVVAPFTSLLDNNKPGCEPYSALLYDREELTPTSPSVPPPAPHPLPPPPIPSFCYAINDISIRRAETTSSTPVGIFASNHPAAGLNQGNHIIPTHIVTPYDNGWIKLLFIQSVVVLDGNSLIYGLPIIGFAAQKYTNANAVPGLLAQYAGIFKHKSQTVITGSPNQGQLSGMNIAKDNTGQVLLYPYYTVRNGLNTLITVVNTSDQVKALKVRFLEGRNGRDVLDFNLYLSAFDVWTAGLVPTSSTSIVGTGFTGQESVKIVTSDTSCTVPVINGHEFLPFAFSGTYDDGLIQDMVRVTEGSFEIIEMAEVRGEDASAATHGVTGVPESCETLNSNWLPPSGKWFSDPTINMGDPDEFVGLYGSVSIIDVAGGVDMSYDATAIIGFSTAIIHTQPGDLLPNLATGNISTTLIEVNDSVLQTTWDSPLNAVTALFMQAQTVNDFVVEPGIGAQTEWVNMFPTKPFYVDPLISGSVMALAPFDQLLEPQFGSCEDHRFKAYNREQASNPSQGPFPIPSPIPPNYSTHPQNCWSVNVADVNAGADNNSIFDSHLFLNDLHIDDSNSSISDLPFTTGWMQMDFVNEIENPGQLIGAGPNGEVHKIFGKPVLGFVVQKYINGNAQPGLLANYATLSMNKNSKKMTVSSAKSEN